MNTLSKKYTSRFFKSDEDYNSFRQYWSSLVNSDRKNELKAVHHLTYIVLCGKNWHKSFALISRQIKLDNGNQSEIHNALSIFGSPYRENMVMEPFGKLVTHEMLVEARKLVNIPYIVGSKYVNDPYIDEAI